MKSIRLRFITFILWLIAFYNFERLFDPDPLSFATYLANAVVLVFILSIPGLIKIPLWGILALSSAIFLAQKAFTGAFTDGHSIVITIIEVSAIGVTIILSRWISEALREFENAVMKITLGRREKLPEPSLQGQGFLYREVRRARNHHRPLALVAVGVNEKSINITIDRLVKEVQLAMMKQYKLASLSKTLCKELEDCSVIVQQDDLFLIAMPETRPEDVPIIIERLRKQVAIQAGVDLKVGVASLPRDGYTFEGLIDKATQEMDADLDSQPFIGLDHLYVEHHIGSNGRG